MCLAVVVAAVRAKGLDLSPLTGPLCLLRTRGIEDHILGGTVCGVLAVAIAGVVFRPNRYTVMVLVVGAAFWLYVGCWVSAIAAC
jgi:hypothetical protein